ncbi:MAG: InlB B-repeat-containing protein [Lachnospiraceae bacterium]|nr:InlB B-repeat-containing protein [Lachnospiraceae bacterium]
MKELRKRVNGLIAILLAVCMSLEMSGEQVAAATTIEFGYNSNIDLSKIESYTPESLQLSEVGDVMERASSGGSFVIDKENSALGITDYFSFSTETASDNTTTYYKLATLNKALPVDYKAIQISGSSQTDINSTWGQVYSITLQWVPAETYTLNYDLNGGTGTAIASRKQQWEKAYSLENPSDWTKKGYAFYDWSFSSDRSGTTYLAGSEITLPNDEITTVTDGQELTLYAVWAPYAYTAMFNPGSVGQENPTGDEMGIMEGSSDQPITLPECTYTLSNYHFAGWKYNGALYDGIADPTDENVGTIYPAGSTFEYLPDYYVSLQFEAQWDPNTVSISYDANGGTGTMAGATYTYDGSIFAYLLPGADGSLSKDGYRFIGWCENADGSSDILPEGYQYPLDFSRGNQDITLYAIWEPNAYSIRFNGNGGTGEMANQAGISSEPTILNPNQFTSIDQMFAGWSTTGTGTVQYADRASFDYKASTNNQVVDLFAIWTKLYKLAFDANGGGGTMDTLLNGIDGIGQTLPECAFTKEGFVFKGWATNPYTLTAEYQPGDTFTYSPQTAGETVTMYAIWEAEGANAADRIQVGLGTVYLTAGQEYFFGEDGVYKVDGDPTAYPMNTIFYVPVSGNYTISVQ